MGVSENKMDLPHLCTCVIVFASEGVRAACACVFQYPLCILFRCVCCKDFFFLAVCLEVLIALFCTPLFFCVRVCVSN